MYNIVIPLLSFRKHKWIPFITNADERRGGWWGKTVDRGQGVRADGVGARVGRGGKINRGTNQLFTACRHARFPEDEHRSNTNVHSTTRICTFQIRHIVREIQSDDSSNRGGVYLTRKHGLLASKSLILRS